MILSMLVGRYGSFGILLWLWIRRHERNAVVQDTTSAESESPEPTSKAKRASSNDFASLVITEARLILLFTTTHVHETGCFSCYALFARSKEFFPGRDTWGL